MNDADNTSDIPCNSNPTGGSAGKESERNAGDRALIPGWGRSPAEGSGNPLQCSCLEKPRDREAWRTAVHGVAKGRTQLSE